MPIDKDHADSAEICFASSCNFCERGCPIYQIQKVKSLTSRGKNRITVGLVKGKIKPSRELADMLLLCTGCGNCDRWCALPNTKDFRKLRSYLIEQGFESDKHKKNADNVRKFGNPYAADNRLAWQTKYKFSTRSKTLLFAGCTMPVKEQETLDKIIKIIGPDNISIMKDEPCCGSYPMRTGYLDLQEELVNKIINHIDKNKIEEIVTICAGCYSTLKESLAEKRPQVKVKHIVELLAENLKSGKLKLKKKYGKITYHDPCHLGRLGNVFDPPREILSQIGTLVEMNHNRFESQCCGAGAGVRASNPKVAEKICRKRIKEAIDTGAEFLVTACPFCEDMFNSVGGLKTRSIIDLVEECQA